ncbi:prepilin-type cleavage/methylation domain-containing protein [Pseudomonadaceae bacterium SI-3]|nr:prepilin-type cleavage/methylation domain-containing protein [Pseudomonadaceae bacterium SI-3]
MKLAGLSFQTSTLSSSLQHGFTLVELIMVIVIMGILAAVVGPRFFDRQSFDERFYFEEAFSAFRYAQKLAVASGCSIEIQLEQDGYRAVYAQDCGDAPIDPKRGYPVAGPAGGDLQGNNPKKVSINQKLTVTFNALGAVDTPASVKFAEGKFELTVHSTGFIEARP